ncbi:MAG TPA: TIGR00725 family protein [Tepiditoga sp.]|nr:TIGR00725 family protein [Thermotogota bacterium]HOO73657.1 TIGR00725 family protein [Tepiditoga sp.]
MKIGFIGYSGNINADPVLGISEYVYEIGKNLALSQHTVFSGGRDGVMDIVSKAVKENGGKCIGVLPWENEGNEYLDYTIKTGLDFSMRSYILVKSVDAVISVGGEIGTAIEILAAYAEKKPVILMRNTGGWTDKVVLTLIENKYLDNRKMVEIYQAYNIEEMNDILRKLGAEK